MLYSIVSYTYPYILELFFPREWIPWSKMWGQSIHNILISIDIVLLLSKEARILIAMSSIWEGLFSYTDSNEGNLE